MSRIGRVPVEIPSGVNVVVKDNHIIVKGPKGELKVEICKGIVVVVEDNSVKFTRTDDNSKAFHGLINRLTQNMIKGVTEGYKKSLEIVGVGFKGNMEGTTLVMNLSYSHPIRYAIPNNIQVVVEKNTLITVTGIDKQAVGQVAATIRRFYPPEPYKGRGIKYSDEHVKRKTGKAVS